MHNPHTLRGPVFLVAALICVVVLPASYAAPAGNLFAAEVPIAERTREGKKDATQRALAEVLIKISGSRTVASLQGAQIVLEAASSYVQQFRYTTNGTMLVGFDGRKLQNEMRVAGLPVWSADRPATLVWLAVDNGNGDRQLLAADDQGDIRNEIEALAASRGIPLIWPLYDSIDRSVVEVADVWGGFAENILNASRRYGTEAVLVARVSRGLSGPFYGTWELNIEGDSTNWRGGFAQSVNRLADFYADRLSVSGTAKPATRLPMSIDGLTSAGAYAEAISTVEKLSVVERVEVIQVHGAQVILELTLRGDSNQVSRALGLSRTLEPAPGNPGMLAYRYAR